MDVSIIKGEARHIAQCAAALMESELGRQYFNTPDKANRLLNEALERELLYVAVSGEGRCAGFIYYMPNGAFHSFPYLHLIAVADEYRGQGIGARLLGFFEESTDASKAFLIVDDFNPRAMKFYIAHGYAQVGELPDLYKKGINGYLMMKTLK